MIDDAFSMGWQTQRRISIVGVGDYFRGDLGLGCYVVSALQEEPLGDDVELRTLGSDASDVDIHLYGAAFAIIIQAVELGEPPGRIQKWDYPTFLERRRLFPDLYDKLDRLHRALARAEFAGALPDELLFVWIEPWSTEGPVVSALGRKAFRLVIRKLKEVLVERDALPAHLVRIGRIYRLDPMRDKA